MREKSPPTLTEKKGFIISRLEGEKGRQLVLILGTGKTWEASSFRPTKKEKKNR